MENRLLYQIALTMINGIGDILGRQLLQAFGNAEAVFAEKTHRLEKIPGIGHTLAAEIKNAQTLRKAEKELAFVEKNNLTCRFITDDNYPLRLHDCPDAPLLLYYKGDANLNAPRIVSVVGTRKATQYGQEITDTLIAGLADVFPDLLIVSGLAYGIDVCAHRSALKHNLPTVAILAHGLDRIYPQAHRATAIKMLQQGGLLTDFPSGTEPDRPNFVRRNRIVAGLSDATVIVESPDKGGSLITADIAASYNRDVFAFPGRTVDIRSQGCNRLIRQNKAALITNADDLISAMNWVRPTDAPTTQAPQPKEKILFSDNADYNRILAILREKQKELHINQLSLESNIPIYQLSSILFDMELDDLITALPGPSYKLKH